MVKMFEAALKYFYFPSIENFVYRMRSGVRINLSATKLSRSRTIR